RIVTKRPECVRERVRSTVLRMPPSSSDKITVGIVMVGSVPPILGGGEPGELFTRTTPIAPASWAFFTFAVNVQVPRSTIAILPATAAAWLWCKQLGDDGSWQDAAVRFGGGTGCRGAVRPEDHHPLCQLVHQFQIELQRPGDHDGGSRYLACSHDDSALGPALPA